MLSLYIVTCQAHPVLVKKGESNMRFVPFKIFYIGGYLACLLLSPQGRTKGSLAPCLLAARAVCWRPRMCVCMYVCIHVYIHFWE